jgi:hypothetical protein
VELISSELRKSSGVVRDERVWKLGSVAVLSPVAVMSSIVPLLLPSSICFRFVLYTS